MGDDTTLAVALSLAKAGLRIHPCRDKAPLLKDPTKDASADPATVTRWFAVEFSGAQIGYYPGHWGVVVCDIDEKDGKSGSASLRLAGLKLPPTFAYATPSGGRHHVYAAPEGEVPGTRNGFLEGVDVRAGLSNVIYYGGPL